MSSMSKKTSFSRHPMSVFVCVCCATNCVWDVYMQCAVCAVWVLCGIGAQHRRCEFDVYVCGAAKEAAQELDAHE